MKTRCFIDWLSFTLPLRHTVDFLYLWDYVPKLFLTFRKDWTQCPPLYGYDVAITCGTGAIAMCHSVRPEMGMHIQLSGQGVEKLAHRGRGILDLLIRLEDLGAKFTRIDVAIDAFDSELDIDALAVLMESEATITSAAKHMVIGSSGGGKTLYVGSRTSERFLRIYNKLAERLAAGADNIASSDWVRIELEVKGDKAKALGRTLVRSGKLMNEIIQDWINGYIMFTEDKTWCAIMGDTSAIQAISHRKLTNSRKWLLNTVARTLAREVVRDEAFIAEFMQRLEEEKQRVVEEIVKTKSV